MSRKFSTSSQLVAEAIIIPPQPPAYYVSANIVDTVYDFPSPYIIMDSSVPETEHQPNVIFLSLRNIIISNILMYVTRQIHSVTPRSKKHHRNKDRTKSSSGHAGIRGNSDLSSQQMFSPASTDEVDPTNNISSISMVPTNNMNINININFEKMQLENVSNTDDITDNRLHCFPTG